MTLKIFAIGMLKINLSIHFGDNKKKSILFANQRETKNTKKANIKHQDIEIKEHFQVTYLGCVMDETMENLWH